ncbi:MAG: nitroreductase family protein [Ekhidna sp.]|nr:nitroreductase family protein [Ekhidna sp.]
MIKKETKNDYPIHDLIKDRWSPRVFSDQQITQEEIHQLLEAGRWAPSSMNSQPWRIIWGLKGDGVYERILECLHPFNKQWASNASALIIGAYKTKRDDGVASFHALHDLGLFIGNLTLQATSMDIFLHQMAGIDPEKASKEFGFPEGYHVATATALGFAGGNIDDLSDKLQEAERKVERVRKPQEAWAFNGNFEER